MSPSRGFNSPRSHKGAGMQFPKTPANTRRNKRKSERRKLRRKTEMECLEMDGKCMNRFCLSLDKRDITRLDPHHIIYRRPNRPDLDQTNNLITLCHICHDRVHNGHQGLTGREFMLSILAQWRTTRRWRWEESYQYLKRKEDADD